MLNNLTRFEAGLNAGPSALGGRLPRPEEIKAAQAKTPCPRPHMRDGKAVPHMFVIDGKMVNLQPLPPAGEPQQPAMTPEQAIKAVMGMFIDGVKPARVLGTAEPVKLTPLEEPTKPPADTWLLMFSVKTPGNYSLSFSSKLRVLIDGRDVGAPQLAGMDEFRVRVAAHLNPDTRVTVSGSGDFNLSGASGLVLVAAKDGLLHSLIGVDITCTTLKTAAPKAPPRLADVVSFAAPGTMAATLAASPEDEGRDSEFDEDEDDGEDYTPGPFTMRAP